MALGRRKVSLADPAGWVFNKMAGVYDARPPYPAALIDAIAALGGPRVLDLGAGIGHLSTPLAARGLQVTAVEPAEEMLARIDDARISRVHAQAEAVPCTARSFELVVLADALHFVDAERTGREVGRLLVPGGALAIVQVELAATPYMNELLAIMHEAAPRRIRRTAGTLTQLCRIADVSLDAPTCFEDHHALSQEQLTRLLASISFLGPAMNEARTTQFHARIAELGPATWSRRFTLHTGRKRS